MVRFLRIINSTANDLGKVLMLLIKNDTYKKIIDLFQDELVEIPAEQFSKVSSDERLMLNNSDQDSLWEVLSKSHKSLPITKIEHFFHDVCNYLQIIHMYNEVILTQQTTIDSNIDNHILATSSKAITKLIDFTSEFYSSEVKNIQSDLEEIDILEMISDIQKLYSDQLESHQIKFQFHVESNLTLFTNKIDFFQCLVNLVKNAIEHIKSMQEPWIRLKFLTGKVWIENSGNFPDKFMANSIFESGFSTKENHINKGLGLCIIKEKLEKHGMTISLIPQKHICFCINLPSDLCHS